MSGTETRVRATRGRPGRNSGVDEAQLRELLQALKSAYAGDLDARMATGQPGLMGEVAEAFNKLADRRDKLGTELSRVARVIGREGRMTERVSLPRAGGSWKTSVEAVNGMIDDLVRPTTEIGRASCRERV